MVDGPDDTPNGDTPKFAICINRRFGSDRPSCGNRGSAAIADAIETGAQERGINVTIERIVCFGMCADGPNMRLVPGGAFHKNVNLDQVDEILATLESACGHKKKSDDIPGIPGS
ncbi:MAG: (2Fe-2S) ferredoxin domain-containing protein [Rhodospirillales bacterium]|nr:(2Fe-2S) ferredoxin domain-containing protein [Rhodospirillales bacterium]MBT4039550.1 (2Fe-2S) ferredoxin domain-containing protein [Rhodospirillales bacterium]MBT4625349.1 (2Fe-2S) ferredoxin domain-containing protein [Rhodospirillales bacterium]MBT5350942.1 (2Fe-2S) ferredoxin domain-containing protein [Rhodospirillales bacterium]MBT5520858.1 (2Fe-2S) ferredoxin domain-containing protein [Rhodospirillales bacterium]